MKVSRTVWSRGKSGDNIKGLPIAIYSSKYAFISTYFLSEV
jgi:hypothetical protein